MPYLNDSRFQLNTIPTVGFSDPILSYLSAVQYLFGGHRMLKEGYEKVISLPLLYVTFSNQIQADTTSTSRQIQAYSK